MGGLSSRISALFSGAAGEMHSSVGNREVGIWAWFCPAELDPWLAGTCTGPVAECVQVGLHTYLHVPLHCLLTDKGMMG